MTVRTSREKSSKRGAWLRGSKKTCLLMLAVAPAAVLMATSARGVTVDTWTGGGADNNWNTGLNWFAGTVPVSTDSLLFTGTTQLNTNNNLSGLSFSGLNFD